ncbi:MAG: nucleoside triphosphate pyrophosphohydrolase [Lachnospiraceae bacterium]|nr:nucleoside triphosphate pyrophosphohydrolase [Lachnospiraceae bacterium]
MEKKQYTYEDFLRIVETLRSENGCPWDREQTHQSLRPCLMEEAAEVLAAIRIFDQTGNYENLQEELGDVLLQVIMHAQIAKEEGIFTIEDVIDEISEKMVRRHPHVFGDVTVEGSGQVLENWEEIKKKEKESRNTITSPLQEIPKELPALTKAVKVSKKVDKLYKPMPDYLTSVKALQEALNQLEKLAPDNENTAIAKEVGDILMSVSNISRICKLSSEQILSDRIEDMIEQYEKV